MSQLAAAIEQLYVIFGAVPSPRTIDGCPCCFSAHERDVLLATPLRQLSAEALSNYASSVTLTVGSVGDLRFFLPRIFELLPTEAFWWPDVEVFFGNLARAEWKTWEPEEVAAITAFAQAQFTHLLEQPEPSGSAISSWVCAFARAGLDLAPFLHQLEAPLVRHKLIEYYEENSEKLFKGKLANSFWAYAPQAMQQVVTWFRSPEVERAIWHGYGLEP